MNKTNFKNIKAGSSIYGEITREGVENLVEYFSNYFNKDTVFYDLGSGVGKMVYHIGIKYKPKKSCGIEYSKERHNYAVSTKNRIGLENCNNIVLLNEDFLESDLSDATVIYTDNTIFSDIVAESIYEAAPRGCLIISRRNINNDNSFIVKGIGSSYSKNVSLFYFTKEQVN